MQIPARLHYAALAMLELAAAEQRREPLAIRQIAVRQGIPQPFLVQILQQLKTAGWVTSTRGSSGGYRLTRSPDTLTLLDIATAIGCCEGGCSADGLPTTASDQLKRVWEQAAAAYWEVLAATTLADLAARCQEPQSAMFYI